MHDRPNASSRLALATLAAITVFVGPEAATAVDVGVEEWSVQWDGFFDDFEDGIHPDGGPGEPNLYGVSCGSLDDDDEFDGALHLRDPNTACGGLTAGNTFGVQGPQTIRGLFRFRIPALGHSFGISIGNEAGDDFLSLSFSRVTILPLSILDGLGVFLNAEPSGAAPTTPIAFEILSNDTETDRAAYEEIAAIELELRTVWNAAGRLSAGGSFRLCETLPCTDEPWQDVGRAAFPPPPEAVSGLGPRRLGAGFFAVGPQPSVDELHEFEVRADRVVDDFEDGAFDDVPPYLLWCGGAENFVESAGQLRMVGFDEACGGLQTLLDAAMPGPLEVRGTFEFQVPEPCDSYGVTFGSESDEFPIDFVALEVHRLPTWSPDHADALVVAARSESEGDLGGPSVPFFARSILRPDAETAEAPDPRAIELRLAVEPDDDVLSPVAQYRLCEALPCPDETALPFADLEPVPEPTDPDSPFCRGVASDFGPPSNGGAITSPEPLASTLLAIPEPSAAAAWLAAALALRSTAVRRQRIGARLPRVARPTRPGPVH